MSKRKLIVKIYEKIVPGFLRHFLYYICRRILLVIYALSGARYYYGQDGEDVLLQLFCIKPAGYSGFYVDIGAFHPEHISNTQWFYERGWRGINIDANPYSIKLFNKKRKRDINVTAGVSDSEGIMDYYYFGENAAMNTFSPEFCDELKISAKQEAKEIIKTKVRSLNSILEEYLPENQYIDFIDIDVERLEMKVLSTFDFEKYAPGFFVVESHEFSKDNADFMEFASSPLYKLMRGNGYIVVAKTRLSIVFKRLDIYKKA